MGGLTDHFNAAAEADVFAIGEHNGVSVDHEDNYESERAVNFRYILETGHIPGIRSDYADLGEQETYVDWDADDAYTRAVDQAHQAAVTRIQADPNLQRLLELESWDREDRIEWERGVSEIVSEEVDKIPGLDLYRTPNYDEDPAQADPSAPSPTPVFRINDLSSDILAGTSEIEYDCDIMAVTEGAILQQIEDTHLPDRAAADGSLKQASAYYMASGQVIVIKPDVMETEPGYHAYIVSSATGAVIETTADPSEMQASYIAPLAGYDFNDFVEGDTFFSPGNAMYVHDADSYEGDFDRVMEELYESFEGEVQALIDYVEEHSQDPEFQAAAEILRFQADNGFITQDMATQIDEFAFNSGVAQNFQRINEMTSNLNGLSGNITGTILQGVEGSYMTPEDGAALSTRIYDTIAQVEASLQSVPYYGSYENGPNVHAVESVGTRLTGDFGYYNEELQAYIAAEYAPTQEEALPKVASEPIVPEF